MKKRTMTERLIIAEALIEGVLQDIPRWIPCSDRLPEDGQNIIVTRRDDGTTDFGQYSAKKNWCVNDGYWPNAFDFITWMPLPDPWKGEEE